AGVIGFARRHSGAGSTDQIMRQLVDGVREYMTGDVDYVGYASAREALRTRAGDCTEFAVLLAAAARSRGIPARVVTASSTPTSSAARRMCSARTPGCKPGPANAGRAMTRD